MSIVLQSTGGGSVSIVEPTTASNFTQTLPASTGTVMVSGNMPAFSAYQSSAQTLSNSTLTKIQFQTEEFDTANAFDNVTNYRFNPQIAGYYQVTGSLGFPFATGVLATIYKNGARFKDGTFPSSATDGAVTALIYFNGSTDYVELYGFMTVGSALTANFISTYFQASMVRAA
jgi:hypothetical protein